MMTVLYELGHFRFRFSCLSVQSIMHTLENSCPKKVNIEYITVHNRPSADALVHIQSDAGIMAASSSNTRNDVRAQNDEIE